MKKTILATSGMPGSVDFTAIMFTLESDNVKTVSELKELARKAAKLYALTNEGCAAYSDNCENFNWGDLVGSAGNKEFDKICDNLGLKIMWLCSAEDELWVDEDEQLMNNIGLEVTDIQWDTDGEKVRGLPDKVTMYFDPTIDVADALSDEYGYCVESYSAHVLYL